MTQEGLVRVFFTCLEPVGLEQGWRAVPHPERLIQQQRVLVYHCANPSSPSAILGKMFSSPAVSILCF